ncbi:MAG: hypothetical protein EU533_08750, partial [Promethearchaeota archaeon]
MPICYHCGENVSETYYCEQCGKNYCSLHRNPITHECNLVIEAEKIPNNSSSYQLASGGDEILRGTIDGTYTWYRQEKQIPDNAFDPDSG